MTKAISKLCAGLCFVGALALAPACGGGGTKSGACEDGQKEAEVNGTTGCYDECVDGACDAGFSCKSGLCIADASTNGMTNGSTNGSTNGTPNGNTNGTTMIDPALVTLCTSYADLLYGMCFDSCTLDADLSAAVDDAYESTLNGDGTAQNPGCPQLLTDNPQFVTQVEDFVANQTCETLSGFRCGELGLTTECSCTPPTLGGACTMDTDCNGGDLDGLCLTEADNGVPGGECVALQCPASDQLPNGFTYNSEVCGTSGVCQNIVPDDGSAPFGVCFAGCETGSCRAGFSCQLANIVSTDDMGGLEVVRQCGESCAANSDCGSDDSWRCNTGTGACELDCDGTPGANGEPSNMDLCTGTGGTCTMDATAGKEYCVY